MAKLVIYRQKEQIPSKPWRRMIEILDENEILCTDNPGELQEALSTAEIAAGRIPFDKIAASPNIKWYQHLGAGVDFLMPYTLNRVNKILLTNASGAAAGPISEHCLALLLALSRQLKNVMRHSAAKKWNSYEASFMNELQGKQVLLCGYGAIGSRVAKLLSPFDVELDIIRRDANKSVPSARRVGNLSQLHEFIPDADIILLTNQLTRETFHMLDEKAFSLMKPHLLLVNIARGALIDERALIHACVKGLIGGAALDVFEVEPLPEESPLWTLPNVIVSPHTAGLSPLSMERAFEIFADNLERYFFGKEMVNLIDKSTYTKA